MRRFLESCGRAAEVGSASWDLPILIGFALILRWAAFSGLALGDDYAYTRLVDELLREGYPRIDSTSVLAARPVMLYLVASSVALFGWSELSLVAPALASSITVIVTVYILGRRLAGRRAGIAAALIMMTLPLDRVHATTLSDDLIGSGLVALGALLLLASKSTSSERNGVLAAGVAGVLVAFSAGVKVSFLALGAPTLVTALVLAKKGYLSTWRATWLVGGWLAGQLVLCGFLWSVADRPFAHIETELAFHEAIGVGNVVPSSGPSFFVQRMVGVALGGHDGYGYSEYSLVFAVGALGVLVAIVGDRRRWAFGICLVWLVVPVLVQLVWPAIVGEAAAGRRLALQLHAATVPAAIAAGTLWRRRSRPLPESRRVALRIIMIGLIALTIRDSTRMVETFVDAMGDQRAAYQVARGFEGQLASDTAFCEFVAMKTRFRESSRCLVVTAPTAVPARALVIVGGSRRPELDPSSVAGLDWEIPRDWIRLTGLPGGVEPWRRERGAVFVALSP